MRATAIAAALGIACTPLVARADDDAAAATAAQRFTDAQQLFDARDFAAALPAFQDALKASNSPNARLYVARCLKELGRMPEAYEEMATTVREAGARADSEPKYAQTRDAAAAELAIIERRVGRVIIAIANAPPGVRVKLDGTALAPERVGEPIAVSPGTRSVSVVGADGGVVTRDVTVAAGETKTLAIALPNAGPRAGPSKTEGPEPDTGGGSGGSGGTVRLVGFAVAGLGVAGLALFGVTGAMAESKFSTLETECGGVRCTDPKYADVAASGRTLDTLANVGLIAGAAGLAIGGTMILFGGPSEPSTTGSAHPTVHAAIAASPGGAALRCGLQF